MASIGTGREARAGNRTFMPFGRCRLADVSIWFRRVHRLEADVSERTSTLRSPIYRVSRALIVFVYGFAIAAVAILMIAFLLRLFNASESAPFVRWIYRSTRVFMQPFRGIFPAIEGESGSVFDPSLLFAAFMYGLLAISIHALIDWIDRKMAQARDEATWAARSQQVVTIPEDQGAPPVAATRPPPMPATSSMRSPRTPP
jgi:uncharacterized protein YggT (Ycf19 family)